MIDLRMLARRLLRREVDRKERIENYIDYFRKMGVKIGNNVDMYDVSIDSLFPFLVEIGDNCIITGGTKILAHDASLGLFLHKYKVGRVKIHDNTFIGMDAIIMPGVEIGPNAIIGANSVVTKTVPPNSVVAGAPARLIETLDAYIRKYQSDNVDNTIITIDSPHGLMSSTDVAAFRNRVRESTLKSGER